jgi:hypothetical protein
VDLLAKGIKPTGGSMITGELTAIRCCSFFHAFPGIHKTISRGIMPGNRVIVQQFGKDPAGKLLAQFYSPLIETVNIPDETLY